MTKPTIITVICEGCGKEGQMSKPKGYWQKRNKHYPHKECLRKAQHANYDKRYLDVPDYYDTGW